MELRVQLGDKDPGGIKSWRFSVSNHTHYNRCQRRQGHYIPVTHVALASVNLLDAPASMEISMEWLQTESHYASTSQHDGDCLKAYSVATTKFLKQVVYKERGLIQSAVLEGQEYITSICLVSAFNIHSWHKAEGKLVHVCLGETERLTHPLSSFSWVLIQAPKT